MIVNADWEIDRSYVASDALLEQAKKVAGVSAQIHNGLASQKKLAPDHDVTGYLCEARGVKVLLDDGYKRGIDFIWFGWNRDIKGGDAWDILFKNVVKIDVKGQSISREFNLLNHEVDIYDHQLGKPIDVYLFVVWDRSTNRLIPLGWATREQFFAAPSYRDVGAGQERHDNCERQGSNAHPSIFRCHRIRVADLNPITDLPEFLEQSLIIK